VRGGQVDFDAAQLIDVAVAVEHPDFNQEVRPTPLRGPIAESRAGPQHGEYACSDADVLIVNVAIAGILGVGLGVLGVGVLIGGGDEDISVGKPERQREPHRRRLDADYERDQDRYGIPHLEAGLQHRNGESRQDSSQGDNVRDARPLR
jgi:hypothetical protein